MSDKIESVQPPSRSAQIDNVFIAPIRTVMVVDDEYPTLDDLLTDNVALNDKKLSNIQRVKDILSICRDKKHGWLVDIYDGNSQGNDASIAGHLRHSDLLILDYHLEWPSSNGDKAISILRELAKSPHFNLVILYTAADINQTVGEIALGLTSEDPKLVMPEAPSKLVRNAIDEWIDHDDAIESKLLSDIDALTFVRIRWLDNANYNMELNGSEFESFKALVASANELGISLSPVLALKWCLSEFQRKHAPALSPTNLGKVTARLHSNEINWIRTGSLFITVVSKSTKAEELPTRLSRALQAWDPLPQRLILSKLQTELDAAGTSAEDELLSNKHLQAGWLQDFLSESQQAIPGTTTIERHWESLGDAIRPQVLKYSVELANSLREIPEINEHRFENEDPLKFQVDGRKIRIETNIHACSKRVAGNHLSVGHILKTTRNGNELYWICMTPACDLVPGQKDSGWMSRLGKWMPFKAVQLHPETEAEGLSEATRNNHLFVKIDDKARVFGFSPRPSATSNPKWEQMFAENGGVFSDENRTLTIAGLSASNEGRLETITTVAQVVAQLRYEYALHLLQRLGANLSRIGLDFQAHVESPTDLSNPSQTQQ